MNMKEEEEEDRGAELGARRGVMMLGLGHVKNRPGLIYRRDRAHQKR